LNCVNELDRKEEKKSKETKGTPRTNRRTMVARTGRNKGKET
jgi:hypothetical protein